MKNITAIISILCLAVIQLTGQSIKEIELTDDGLVVPRFTTTDRNAISPNVNQESLIVYDLNEKKHYFFNGTHWLPIDSEFINPWADSTDYLQYSEDYISVSDSSAINIFENESRLYSDRLEFNSNEDSDILVYGKDSITTNSFSGESIILNSNHLMYADGTYYGEIGSKGFETGLLDSGSGDIVLASLKAKTNGGELLVSDSNGNNTVVISQNSGGFIQIKNVSGDTLLTISGNNINDSGLLLLNGTKAKINIEGLDIGYKAGGSLGLDGDVIPYNSSSYDIGNNLAGQHWDDMVANDFINFSDVRLKENVKSMDSGSLQKLMQMNPVHYRYKKNVDVSQRVRYGLIAQEVQKILPEIVISEDIDIGKDGRIIRKKADHLALNYIDFIPHLIKGIQEQQKEIEDLRREVNILINKNK